MKAPVLDQINIVSADPKASVTFYRRLEVAIPEQQIWRTASWNSGWQGHQALQGRMVVGFKLDSRSAADAV